MDFSIPFTVSELAVLAFRKQCEECLFTLSRYFVNGFGNVRNVRRNRFDFVSSNRPQSKNWMSSKIRYEFEHSS